MKFSTALFAHQQFRLLFLGRAVSFLGNAVAPVALAFAVLDLTGSKSDLGCCWPHGRCRRSCSSWSAERFRTGFRATT